MSKRKGTVTMKDVALEAGVALGTVSKVINGIPVGDAYRVKVEEAIEKLGYHANSYAQGLRAQKTNTIALLIPNTLNPFFAAVTQYVNVALMERGYRMLICCTEFDPALEQDYVSMVKKNQVDGIIGLTYNPELLVDEATPFVSIDRYIRPGIPCIASDNFAGGQMAAEKLGELGCKKALFLRTGSSLTNEPNKRKAGFENGCRICGMEEESFLIEDGDDIRLFDDFLKKHISEGQLGYDGIFCATDFVAFYVKKVLTKEGIRIPEDVQLIGYDGVRYFNAMDYICSTIVQPVEDMCKLCVDFALQSMSMKPPLICLPVRYAPGGTTKEPAEEVEVR